MRRYRQSSRHRISTLSLLTLTTFGYTALIFTFEAKRAHVTISKSAILNRTSTASLRLVIGSTLIQKRDWKAISQHKPNMEMCLDVPVQPEPC